MWMPKWLKVGRWEDVQTKLLTEDKTREEKRFEYADYVHKIICMDKNMSPTFEVRTWMPKIIQFLVDGGIIRNPPEEGEQISIVIKKYTSDGEEPWNN